MITNDRQLRISKARLSELEEEIQNSKNSKTADKNSVFFLNAYLGNLRSELKRIEDAIQEYEALASGALELIPVSSLEDLPLGLIKARIARDLSQKDLAELIGVKEQQIQRYESQRYQSIGFSRLVEIAKALKLEINPNVLLAGNAIELPAFDSSKSATLKALADKLPVDEMYKKGWFTGFRGTLQEARSNAGALIEQYFSQAASLSHCVAHKKHVRAKGSPNQYALVGWQLQVINLALKQKLAKFDRALLTDAWLKKLISFSADKKGPLLAREFLNLYGIAFIVLPHLSKTYLDGCACLLSSGRPVIAMTLRHDRLDNFWFVLAHEVAHIKLHLSASGEMTFFDNLDVEGNEMESEADRFSYEMLLPEAEWEVSIARYMPTADTVVAMAKERKINPAIIAGRLRREQDNWTIFNDLIGAGSVRRLFPEVQFAS